MKNKSKQTLTIIVPVFNEYQALPKFLDQLKPVVRKLQQEIECRLIFVDNGSTDKSREVLIKGVFLGVPSGVLTLSRNFGYETALIAGLHYADSDFYCFCDSDGEDPVELIPKFLQSMKNGFYIALGIRKKRFEPLSTKMFRQLAYVVAAKISDDPFTRNGGNFSMFNQAVKTAILQENSSFPFLRATLTRCGLPLEKFEHNRKARLDGRSKHKKLNLLKFAVAGFLTTTTWPLRVVAYLSIISSLLIILFSVIKRTNFYFETFVILEFFMFFTFISLYLARVYKNSLGKPLFYVNWDKSITLNKFKWNITHK